MLPNGGSVSIATASVSSKNSACQRSSRVMIGSDGRCFVLPRNGAGYHGNSNNNTGEAEEPPVSRTYQYRKVMKPMLERKRRARINRCLDELKELMLTALQAEGENVSKLEKADILELTVRHLHKLRRQRALNLTRTNGICNVGNNSSSSSSSSSSSNICNVDDNSRAICGDNVSNVEILPSSVPTYVDRFRAGFTHCAAEVTQYLASVIQQQQLLQQQRQYDSSKKDDRNCDNVDDLSRKQRMVIDHSSSLKLLQHLGSCIQRIENNNVATTASGNEQQIRTTSSTVSSYVTPPCSPSPCDSRNDDVNNIQPIHVWRPW